MEAPKKKGILIKKAKDHWDFLEDIEAPMWADLTLEAKANSVGEIMSDDWFSKSHPFHQWSACQSKSMFSHPGEGPDLPSSVSRSRGKHYISKKWEGINLNNLLDQQQGLSKRCFQAGSSFGQEMKPKSTLNVSRPKGSLSAKSGLNFEHNARGNAKAMTNFRNPKISSTSVDNKTSEINTRSTITSENTHQHQKYMEVSSQPCDQKSRSVSSLRNVSLMQSCFLKNMPGIQQKQKYMAVSSQPCDQKSGSTSVTSVSLRKSYVTEKASGLDIVGNSMKPRGRKSSSGKSSVGSSSNPGYEVKSVSKHQKDKIAHGKDVITMNISDKNKCKLSNISQTSSYRKESNGRLYHRTAKSVVQYQPRHKWSLLPFKVNKADVAEKLRTSKVNSLTGKGKENAASNVRVNQKCIEGGVRDGGMLKNHRAIQCSHLQNVNTAGSSVLPILVLSLSIEGCRDGYKQLMKKQTN